MQARIKPLVTDITKVYIIVKWRVYLHTCNLYPTTYVLAYSKPHDLKHMSVPLQF